MQAKSLPARNLSSKALELVESLEAKVSIFVRVCLEKSKKGNNLSELNDDA